MTTGEQKWEELVMEALANALARLEKHDVNPLPTEMTMLQIGIQCGMEVVVRHAAERPADSLEITHFSE